jgi:predicted regulator of Ras-like GTPase activity (Roadblock/LC7/MglB family)
VYQPGLSADLDSFDLLDLVQVIQMARRSLALVVREGAQRLGMLRFSQGELLWAEFGALRGEEAFLALAAHHSGSIEEVAWDGRDERNVNQLLSRLVIQAVEYRETHEHPQPPRPPIDTRSRPIQPLPPLPPPIQPITPLPPPIKPYERFNGSDGSPRLGSAPPEPQALEPDEESAPSWVREIHAAQTESSFSSFLREEMAMQIPEPTVPLSTPNGKFTLPALANGSPASLPPAKAEKDDPPTVPLPSVQGGLRNYAARREPVPQEAPREAAPTVKLAIDSLPGQTLAMRPAPAVTAPTSLPPVPPAPAVSALTPLPPISPAPTVPTPPALPLLPDELLPTTAPLPPNPPPAEPKLSSMAILEQLAYGGLLNNGSVEVAVLETSAPPPAAAPSAFAGAAPAVSNSPAPLPTPPAASGPPTPAPAPSAAEGARNIQQALEAFAEQVGVACIATAVIRSDGLLLAEYKVRRGQDQDLSSPAYHMAQVMQSSLRALLMGGWGDLEDTFITGSTHSVMLRRLGRAEKGLFHVAVLERSGNPGLCRVRMRNNEAALLQMLSAELPITTS